MLAPHEIGFCRNLVRGHPERNPPLADEVEGSNDFSLRPQNFANKCLIWLDPPQENLRQNLSLLREQKKFQMRLMISLILTFMPNTPGFTSIISFCFVSAGFWSSLSNFATRRSWLDISGK